MTDEEFSRRIVADELGLFAAIPSQSSDEDKRSWLALQCAVREAQGQYTYLEIGSHLGGSLQQHLLDPRCHRIFSIDPRPFQQPDERGGMFGYEGNSTARMLENLRRLAPERLGAVTCFDVAAPAVDPAKIQPRPNLCFIDGEHTVAAVLVDFEFCYRVAAPDAVIAFHDDSIVCDAIRIILRHLTNAGGAFAPLKLGGATFAIALGDSKVGGHEQVRRVARDGWGALRRMMIDRWTYRHVPLCFQRATRRALRVFVR